MIYLSSYTEVYTNLNYSKQSNTIHSKQNVFLTTDMVINRFNWSLYLGTMINFQDSLILNLMVSIIFQEINNPIYYYYFICMLIIMIEVKI